MTRDIVLERGMPVNVDVEKIVLGSFLLRGTEALDRFRPPLTSDCFSIEKHRLILGAIDGLHRQQKAVDRVTVAEELQRRGQLESVDGVSYLVSLDDGLPNIPNLDSYVDILIEKAALRRIAVLAQNTLNRALLAEERAEDIVSSAKSALDGVEARREEVSWMDLDAAVRASGGNFEDFISPARATSRRGIVTPWAPINDCICGIQPGELFLIAARPGMGKSGAAVQLARCAAEQGRGVAYVSLEMSAAALERRLLAQMANVDAFRMRSGFLTHPEREAIRQAIRERSDLPLLINATGCRTAPAIVSAVRAIHAKKPVGMVIVDHFHLVRGIGAHEDERVRYSRIADDFQTAARETGIAWVLLCQLSRKCEEENRAPGLSDLKETGKLEENADVVLFIHRPEMYARNRGKQELRGIAEMIIAKQRDGTTGKCSMTFVGAQQRFEQTSEESEWAT